MQLSSTLSVFRLVLPGNVGQGVPTYPPESVMVRLQSIDAALFGLHYSV